MLVGVPSLPARAQTKVLDVPLRRSSVALLRSVEKGFGTSVRFEEVGGWELSRYGESSVEPDGTIVVRLNAHSGKTEATVVHELWHLKLKLSGFPLGIRYRFPEGRGTDANKQYMQWIGLHLRDPIEHYIFYPKMRKMGIEPDRELKGELLDAMKNDRFPNLVPGPNEGTARALYFLKARLQLEPDRVLLAKLSAWYTKQGWEADRVVGERIAGYVTQSSLDTEEQEINVFLRCINDLLKSSARFVLHDWEGPLGRKVANIDILPPL